MTDHEGIDMTNSKPINFAEIIGSIQADAPNLRKVVYQGKAYVTLYSDGSMDYKIQKMDPRDVEVLNRANPEIALTNHVEEFILDTRVVDSPRSNWALNPNSRLRAEYGEWCTAHGYEAESSQVIGMALSKSPLAIRDAKRRRFPVTEGSMPVPQWSWHLPPKKPEREVTAF